MAAQKISKSFDQLLPELRRFGFQVNEKFLIDTFGAESTCSFNEAHEELIHFDFRKSSYLDHSFSPTINTVESDTLQGPVVLQVNSIINISQPSSRGRQHEESNPRMLIMKLTDGHTTATAVEYEKIPDLTTKVAPGTKLLVKKNAKICCGKILLSGQLCRVLGGRVDHLYKAWLTNRTTISNRRQQKTQEVGNESPPEFELKMLSISNKTNQTHTSPPPSSNDKAHSAGRGNTHVANKSKSTSNTGVSTNKTKSADQTKNCDKISTSHPPSSSSPSHSHKAHTKAPHHKGPKKERDEHSVRRDTAAEKKSQEQRQQYQKPQHSGPPPPPPPPPSQQQQKQQQKQQLPPPPPQQQSKQHHQQKRHSKQQQRQQHSPSSRQRQEQSKKNSGRGRNSRGAGASNATSEKKSIPSSTIDLLSPAVLQRQSKLSSTAATFAPSSAPASSSTMPPSASKKKANEEKFNSKTKSNKKKYTFT